MKKILLGVLSTSFIGVVLILGGCSGKIHVKHPLLQDITPETPVATVYFIRPQMLKPKGSSDNILSISLNGETLLDIRAGSYTLVKILPGKARVATHSLTEFTNKTQPIKVSRYRDYNFVEDRTYFIHIARVNEEFRGVFFDPHLVDLRKAKTLLYPVLGAGSAASAVRPFGAATEAPLSSLEYSEPAPEPSEISPATPESLYPGEKYILQPSPFLK